MGWDPTGFRVSYVRTSYGRQDQVEFLCLFLHRCGYMRAVWKVTAAQQAFIDRISPFATQVGGSCVITRPPEGVVEFTSGTNSELVLDINESGGIVQETRDDKKPTQQWVLRPVDGDEGFYHITRYGGDDGGDVSVLAAANQWSLAVQPLQPDRKAKQWELQPVPGNTYKIKNRQYPKILSVNESSDQPGASIILYEDQDGPNQKWGLRSSKQAGVGPAGLGGWVGIAGGLPFCDWKPIPPQMNGRPYVPITVELFRDPLNPHWAWKDNLRTRITRSISFEDKRAPEYEAVKGFNDIASAVVVRPGPNFNPHLLYKVTLYADWNYRGWLLPLTLGVYPNLHNYQLADATSSVKFEQGIPKDFKDPYSGLESYYAEFFA